MPSTQALSLAPLIVLLSIASVIDLRVRRIPNWLNLLMAASGLLSAICWGHPVGVLASVCGMLLGLVLNIGLFALGIRGGGDVKMFAGVGAWIGPMPIFAVFILSTIFAALLAIVQCAANGRLRVLFRNTATLALSIIHPRELAGVGPSSSSETSAESGAPCGSVPTAGRPVPYAVPVLASVLVLVARNYF